MTIDDLAFRCFRETYPHMAEDRLRETWDGYTGDAEDRTP